MIASRAYHCCVVTNACVCVYCRHRGVVAFVGEVHYAKGVYVGVICNDRSVGKNNGELSCSICCAGPYLLAIL